KPQNIMLARGTAGRDVVKLVDFGIAKTFDESTQLTSVGSALGTPYYMAPEQIEGRPVDARCDIYALGIILYEMLVGEVPFADQSTPAVLVKQLRELPVRPSLRNPTVPPALEAIALRCLEKDPEQRFQAADAFGAALNEAAVALNANAAGATVPMGRADAPASAGTPQAGATMATVVSPAGSPASGVPSSVSSSPMDTKPTIPQPAASLPSEPQPAAP